MSDKEDLKLLKKTFEEFIKSSTELQQSYEALKERSSRLSLFLSNILDNIKSAILVIDHADNLLLWNHPANLFFPILDGQEAPFALNHLSSEGGIDLKTIMTDEREVIEIEIPSSDSRESESRWYEIQSTDFINSKREKIGYIVMINDKTELKQLQIKSQQEDRLRVMGELAAEVAHEIRNPLGSIELMVSLLQEDASSDPKQGEILKRIRSSVNSMNHTVTNILLYTRDIKLKKSEFDVHDLFEESKNLALMTIMKKQVEMKISEDNYKMTADFELLRQSIGNVILNAAEAVEPGGQIHLKARTDDDRIKIEIEDNGSGIPEEVQDKVFHPFFTTKNTGTGLGLAMVKRIVQAHNGRIDLESSANGTLFIFSFPIK